MQVADHEITISARAGRLTRAGPSQRRPTSPRRHGAIRKGERWLARPSKADRGSGPHRIAPRRIPDVVGFLVRR